MMRKLVIYTLWALAANILARLLSAEGDMSVLEKIIAHGAVLCTTILVSVELIRQLLQWRKHSAEHN
jgi:hypothetical protein